jgi:TM2 domain-containing membrane protein YozV
MTTPPPPGWYPNAHGQPQWWDGRQWTIVATPPPQLKSTGIAYLFLLLLGGFSAHRFYLRRYVSAIFFNVLWWGGWATVPLNVGAFLVLGAGIWLFIDLIILPGMVREENSKIWQQRGSLAR